MRRALLWSPVVLAEAESWGCCTGRGASYLALGLEPRLRLVRAAGLNDEFLELESCVDCGQTRELQRGNAIYEEEQLIVGYPET